MAADLKACPAAPSLPLARPKPSTGKASSVPERSLPGFKSQKALYIPIYAIVAFRSALTGKTDNGTVKP